ncbi:MAG TPA: PA2169 family four-helix-bundle protein [Flavobacteriaceae bacterium]|nr:PA2169 family four-helix-bundle protein [Flavobacteriaceae bacterium]
MEKTTKEKADENIHDNIVENLQDLLKENYDAEKVFKQGIENTDNIQLKRFLQNQALQRNRFADELTHEILELNEKPTQKSTVAGDIHRAWVGLKNSFSSNNDETVLKEAINGEKSSMEEYKNRLEKHNFPPRIRQVVQRQADEIHETLQRIRTYEDLANFE